MSQAAAEFSISWSSLMVVHPNKTHWHGSSDRREFLAEFFFGEVCWEL